MLLLNAGHAENLTMGYQIAFTLTVGWLTAFVAAGVWADWLGPRRVALAGGLATLGVSVGGGVGWAFVPGLVLATTARIAAALRRSPNRLRDAVALWLAPTLAAAYVCGCVVELRSGGVSRPINDPPQAVGVAF